MSSARPLKETVSGRLAVLLSHKAFMPFGPFVESESK